MKKIAILILMFVLFAGSAFAQRPVRTSELQVTGAAKFYGTIQGSTDDSAITFQSSTHPSMVFSSTDTAHVLGDSLGGIAWDSSDASAAQGDNDVASVTGVSTTASGSAYGVRTKVWNGSALVTMTDVDGNGVKVYGGTDESCPITPDGSANEVAACGSGAVGVSVLGGGSNLASIFFGDSADANIGRLTYDNANDSLDLYANNTERLSIQSGGEVLFDKLSIMSGSEFVFNEDGADEDFRIESDSDTEIFCMNAGTNKVGISTCSPAGLFQVDGSTSYVNAAVFNLNEVDASSLGVIGVNLVDDTATNDGGTLVAYSLDGVIEGSMVVNAAGDVSLNAFNGGHYTQLKAGQQEPPLGAVVVSTGELVPSEVYAKRSVETEIQEGEALESILDEDGNVIGRKKRHGVKFRSGRYYKDEMAEVDVTSENKGIARKEYFPFVSTTATARNKAVYGVWGGKIMNDARNMGFGQTNKPVYQIIQAGLYKCRVTDTEGNIDIGDFLTTSTRAGEGQKQTVDDLRHSYTYAKAIVPVDFATVPVDPVLGYKWALTSCLLY